MADFKTLKVNGKAYDVKDAGARALAERYRCLIVDVQQTGLGTFVADHSASEIRNHVISGGTTELHYMEDVYRYVGIQQGAAVYQQTFVDPDETREVLVSVLYDKSIKVVTTRHLGALIDDKHATETTAYSGWNINNTFYSGSRVTMTGPAVATDMVAPVEHEVFCKLSGVPNPSKAKVSVLGRNILPNTYQKQTIYGVTFDPQPDGSVVTSGTATSDAYYFLTDKANIVCRGVPYFVQGCPVGGGKSTFSITSIGFSTFDTGSGYVMGADTAGASKNLVILIKSGVNADGKVFKPMMVLKATTLGAYAPYDSTIYTPSPDGTVPGVRSVSPDMTILTDMAGVSVEATYMPDLVKYIDSKLKQAAAPQAVPLPEPLNKEE